jgi:hypothetical protein
MVLDNIRKKYSLIVYVCIGIFCFCGVLGLTTFSQFYPDQNHYLLRFLKVIRFFLILIVIDNFICNGFNLKKFAVFVFFMFILAFSKTNTFELFDLLFIPYLLNDKLDYKKVYKIYLVSIILCALLAFYLYFIDVLPTKMYHKFDIYKVYTLGFRHPNILGFVFLLLGILYFLLRKNITLLDSFILLLCSFGCFYITSSRTSVIIFILLSILSIVCVFVKDLNNWDKNKLFYLSLLFYFSIIAIFYFLSFSEFGRHTFFEKYLRTVAARLYMGQEAFYQYGFSWLGQKIHFVGDYHLKGERYFVVDCLYMYLPIASGIITTVFFIASHVLALKYTISKNDLRLFIVQILFIIFEMSEGLSYRNGLELFIFVLPFAGMFLNNQTKMNKQSSV